MIHVRTDGSHWFIDNQRMQYMRTPIVEGPREEPYKEMSEGTVLEDFKWHPMTDWYVSVSGRLTIGYLDQSGEETHLSAPGALIVSSS